MLKLRPLVPEDAENLADWGMDQVFRVAADWANRDRDQHLRFHQDLIEHLTDDPSRLAVTDHDQLVGYVDFTPDDTASCELGIVIGPSQRWGHHLGRRAITLATQHARRHYAASRVWARTHTTNAASRHMLVAAGFVEVGPCGTDDYRGETVTIIEYELL